MATSLAEGQEEKARKAGGGKSGQSWLMALAEALGGRAKVVVDADRLPTRRLLWLAPFDLPAGARPGGAARPRPADGEP